MKKVRDLHGLTIHDVQIMSNEWTTGRLTGTDSCVGFNVVHSVSQTLKVPHPFSF